MGAKLQSFGAGVGRAAAVVLFVVAAAGALAGLLWGTLAAWAGFVRWVSTCGG